MSPLQRMVAAVFLLMILLSVCATEAVADGNENRGLMKPTRRCVTTCIGDVDYASGDIYLSSHVDTVALKRLGFRDFECLGRSVGSIRYHAFWPISVQPDSLPAGVSGINYVSRPEKSSPDCYVFNSWPSVCGNGRTSLPNRFVSTPNYRTRSGGMPSIGPSPFFGCSGGGCSR